ncbi:hypothetical protein A3Q56_04395, partial [Intoshia linei]
SELDTVRRQNEDSEQQLYDKAKSLKQAFVDDISIAIGDCVNRQNSFIDKIASSMESSSSSLGHVMRYVKGISRMGGRSMLLSLVLAQDPNIFISNTDPPREGNLVTVRQGEDVIIDCRAENMFPNNKVVWQKSYFDRYDRRQIVLISTGVDVEDTINHAIEKPTEYTWRLRIKNVQFSADGNYSCIVQLNKISLKFDHIQLKSWQEPIINKIEGTNDITVSSGDTIHLVCNATGRPTSQIEWMRLGGAPLPNGINIFSGEILRIEEIEASQRGFYQCKAMNRYGVDNKIIRVRMIFQPIIQDQEANIYQSVGYRTELICIVESNPEPHHLSWSFVGREILDLPGIYKLNKFKSAFDRVIYELVIYNVKKSSFGNYVCEAINSIGSTTKVVTLLESKSPVASIKLGKIMSGSFAPKGFIFGGVIYTQNVGIFNKLNTTLTKRTLKIHEHAAIELLNNMGIPTPRQFVANSPDEVYSVCEKLKKETGKSDVVIKAQILAGGRGKGLFESGLKGGVKILFSSSEAQEMSSRMLGHRIVTKQTGKPGIICRQVSLCERLYCRKEFYFAITLDRSSANAILIGSSAGGVDIEQVAEETPSKIFKLPVNINEKLDMKKLKEFTKLMGFDKKNIDQASEIFSKIYNFFIEKDSNLIEINPIAENNEGQLYCMDCKMIFDDNSSFRQKDIFKLRDDFDLDERDIEAKKFGLNYISLDGNVGCLVNGAGLAMSTMDLIQLYGGKPANFLDVGGGASANQVTEAFRIILSDDKVEAIFVNIFGGIMKCDVIATGIIEAAKTLHIKIPIIVRLEGTNVDEAKVLIANSSFKILPCDSLGEAAKMAVKVSEIVHIAKKASIDVKFELPI